MNQAFSQDLNGRFGAIVERAAKTDLDTAGYNLLIASIGYVLHPDAPPTLADALSNAAKLFNQRCREQRAISFMEAMIAVLECVRADETAAPAKGGVH